MPLDGSATWSQPDFFRPETWTSDASGTCGQTISAATLNATSSLASAAGPTPLASPDGPTTGRSGRAPRPASHGASPATAPVRTTRATSGPSCSASLPLAGHPCSSASRSQTQHEHGQPKRGKACKGCGEHKPFSAFYADGKGRTRAHCVECCKAKERQRKAGSAASRSASHKEWRKNNRASVLISAARFRAKQKGLAFDLDEWKERIGARIALGRCEMTGLPLNMEAVRAWDSPSLDRIVPEDGYTIGNVRVVLFALNVMMNTWGKDVVLKVAETLKAKEGKAQTAPLADWEANLKRRLSRPGLTAWPATWRASATPSGRVFSRLAASARSTAGTGFILWPTPAARDYRAPNAPDGESRGKRPPKSGRQLPNEIVVHLGGATDSSAGQTGSLGWLSQEFACSLMGYPPEWIALAPSAMPSSRSSPPR